MLVEVREELRGGASLAQAMREHPDWFDAIDIAVVEAGQHSGTLPSVLLGIAERQERSSELSHRLLSALAYPTLVLCVGLGVVVFLSVKTLPDLTKILVDAKIPVPGLTARVMWFGQLLAAHWIKMGALLLAILVIAALTRRLWKSLSIDIPPWIQGILARVQPPRVLRRMLVGGLVAQLSELLRSGVPMVEALRVIAPTQRSARLAHLLTQAAHRIEHGDDLSASLDDRAWFDPELQRLLEIGQASGELDEMLARIGERYQRRAKRLIDRLTVLLEPAVLLLLASLVGIVVMAAVLPLLALQEIIR
jgi:type II secretory pathway component PulF